jgi:hypothetical protein
VQHETQGTIGILFKRRVKAFHASTGSGFDFNGVDETFTDREAVNIRVAASRIARPDVQSMASYVQFPFTRSKSYKTHGSFLRLIIKS